MRPRLPTGRAGEGGIGVDGAACSPIAAARRRCYAVARPLRPTTQGDDDMTTMWRFHTRLLRRGAVAAAMALPAVGCAELNLDDASTIIVSNSALPAIDPADGLQSPRSRWQHHIDGALTSWLVGAPWSLEWSDVPLLLPGGESDSLWQLDASAQGTLFGAIHVPLALDSTSEKASASYVRVVVADAFGETSEAVFGLERTGDGAMSTWSAAFGADTLAACGFGPSPIQIGTTWFLEWGVGARADAIVWGQSTALAGGPASSPALTAKPVASSLVIRTAADMVGPLMGAVPGHAAPGSIARIFVTSAIDPESLEWSGRTPPVEVVASANDTLWLRLPSISELGADASSIVLQSSAAGCDSGVELGCFAEILVDEEAATGTVVLPLAKQLWSHDGEATDAPDASGAPGAPDTPGTGGWAEYVISVPSQVAGRSLTAGTSPQADSVFLLAEWTNPGDCDGSLVSDAALGETVPLPVTAPSAEDPIQSDSAWITHAQGRGWASVTPGPRAERMQTRAAWPAVSRWLWRCDDGPNGAESADTRVFEVALWGETGVSVREADLPVVTRVVATSDRRQWQIEGAGFGAQPGVAIQHGRAGRSASGARTSRPLHVLAWFDDIVVVEAGPFVPTEVEIIRADRQSHRVSF